MVIAKAPVPGEVKTRLCPPCTPEQAALVARAALEDTLSTVDDCPAARRVLVVAGEYPVPAGWEVVRQRGDGLGERLAAAFTDAARLEPLAPALLVGMDTPQLTPELVARLGAGLERADAVLGPAGDGGWWGSRCATRRMPRSCRVSRCPHRTPDGLPRRPCGDWGFGC